MTASREAAYEALFNLVSDAYEWASTPARRAKLWGDVPLTDRPTLFQYEGGADQYVWKDEGQLVKRTISARLFIYTDAKDPTIIGSTQLNNIVDSVEAVIAPPRGDDGTGLMTLGGTVYQTRIIRVDRTPGDIDGDGIAIVDVEIILP